MDELDQQPPEPDASVPTPVPLAAPDGDVPVASDIAETPDVPGASPLPDVPDVPGPLVVTGGAHGRPAATGWAALGRALRPRATRSQLLAGLLCAVLGFAVVAQIRQAGDSNLSDLREDDLVRLLDESSSRLDQLNQEAADLAAERDELLSGSDSRQVALEAARRNAATQGILSGRLPAEGPGVEVVLSDPDGSIRPFTMLNVLEELRNAGAEAIQLQDQRVTASSSFTGAPGAVQLDGVTLTEPYRWLVIGDPDTIATALEIPGGALAYVRNDGGTGHVESSDLVRVTALRAVADPQFATPVPVGQP